MDESGEVVAGDPENDIPRNPRTPLEMVSKATQIRVSGLKDQFHKYELQSPIADEGRDIVFADPDNLLIVGKSNPEDSFKPFQRRYARYNPQTGLFETSYNLIIGRDAGDPLNLLRPVNISLGGEGGRETARLRFGGEKAIGASLFVSRGNANIKVEFDLTGRLVSYNFDDSNKEDGIALLYDPSTGNYVDFVGNSSESNGFGWSRDSKTGKLSILRTEEGEITDDIIVPTELDLLQARENMIPDDLLKNPVMENIEVDKGWKIDPLMALGGRWERVGGPDRTATGE